MLTEKRLRDSGKLISPSILFSVKIMKFDLKLMEITKVTKILRIMKMKINQLLKKEVAKRTTEGTWKNS